MTSETIKCIVAIMKRDTEVAQEEQEIGRNQIMYSLRCRNKKPRHYFRVLMSY